MKIEMNKLYILSYCLFAIFLGVVKPTSSLAQQSLTGNEKRVYNDANYSYTLVPQTAIKRLNDVWFIDSSKYQESASFVDPLGRSVIATIFNAGNSLDIVKYNFYDQNGRAVTDYLPFAASTNLGFLDNPIDEQSAFYANASGNNIDNDSKAYSTIELEASPLGRVISQTGAGAAWQNNGKKTTYSFRVNTANEVLNIEPLSDEGYFSVVGYHGAGTLSVTETTNPDGVTLKRYTDGDGKLILTDQAGSKTYYVYDEFGRVTFVLPPLVTESLKADNNVKYLTSNAELTTSPTLINTLIAEDGSSVTLKPPFSFKATTGTAGSLSISASSRLYFHYVYDDNGRLIKKYQPSKEVEEYVYDILNRPIMYRDGNLRKAGKWKYIKYDVFGRLAYWGVISLSATQTYLQGAADYASAVYEDYTSGSYTYSKAYPTVTESSIMEEYVYDSHFSVSPAPPANEGIAYALGSAKGLLTRTRSRVLDSNSWLTTYFYYNDDGQLVFTQRVNELMGTNQRTYAEFNFAGQVTRTVFVHCENNVPKLTLNYSYSYTPQGKAKSISVEIPGLLTSNQIVSYEYNALGELVKRNLGQNGTSGYLQQVDYYYNLRGWLTRINNVDDASSGDLFSQKLHYTDGLAAVNGAARYDGSVSANQWRIKGENPQKMAYGYQYDAHNRLTNAKYASGSSFAEGVDSYSESFSYDSNGNIKALQRKGKRTDGNYNIIDNLTYTYSGDQLSGVSDAVDSSLDNLGFKNGNTGSVDYTYDSNGNMSKDLNKGITGVTYNILNLPQTVTVSSPASQYTFTYTASGEKLRVVEVEGTNTQTLSYDGPLTFQNATLMSIATPEGRISSNGYSSYAQEYFIADNQGNVRVTFDMYNGAARILNERNFYPSGLSYLNKNNPAVNHFGYGGKEEYVSPLNWLDFHARMYDPTIARWHVSDPLAEQTPTISPYVYCLGNPVNFVDPTGMTAEDDRWKRIMYGLDNTLNMLDYGGERYGDAYEGGSFGLPGAGDNGGGLHGVYYDWISGTCRDVSTKQVVNSPIILPEDIERSYYGQEAIDLLASLNNMMTGEYAVTLTDVSIGKAPSLLSKLSPMPDELAPQEDVSFSQFTGGWIYEVPVLGFCQEANDALSQGKYALMGGFLVMAFVDIVTWGREGQAYRAAKSEMQGGLNLFKWGAEQTGRSTGWKAGDYMLHLPNKGTPKLNWKANYGALRYEMKLGKPIFDSYRLPNGNLIPTGGFLNAERFTLQTRGWIYNPSMGAWMPPF